MLSRIKSLAGRILLLRDKYIQRHRFIKNNNGNIHPSIEISGAEYIKTGLGCCIGEGSKLLCKDFYTSGITTQPLKPNLQIGYNFHATRNLVIQCGGSINIGNNVLIASDVFIIDYNHGMNASYPNYLDSPLEIHDINISDGVWIGNNVIILPGVSIGKKCIIAAGSVVTKSIPDYTIAAGNPAKVIKYWDHKTKQWLRINDH